MAHEIPVDFQNHSTRIINGDTGQLCQPVKAVDITEHCSGPDHRRPVIIVYARNEKGLFIQFREDGERVAQLTLIQMEEELHIQAKTAFGTRAKLLGMNRQKLWEIFLDNAPAS